MDGNLILLLILGFAAFFAASNWGQSVARRKLEEKEKAVAKKEQDAEARLQAEKDNFEQAKQQAAANLLQVHLKFEADRKKLDSDIDNFHLLLGDTAQRRPDLAQAIADAQYYLDLGVADDLMHKPRPALKAAEDLKRIATEKKHLLVENRMLHYQLDFYESMFPWLEDYKEVPIEDAVRHASRTDDREYDAVKEWLSPDEYSKLSNANKFQLALDRWQKRKKTAWDIGIEYERYIGYLLECEGYKVKYLGATMGLDDMGRDLLATKNGVSLVIQCKRWAKEKTIHEKHICQLYGSVAVLASQNPHNKYIGVFITTTNLSDVAKRFAEYSNIKYVENCPFSDHPLIKCNISKTGEKIYHLPFDQQYDRVEIFGKPGAYYAKTTKHAEDAGFRHAYRWHPDT